MDRSMKKRGFTLIELLAVIVILAIIALIATPIVMNLIENARKGAAERSAENYLDAVETAIASKRLDNGTIPSGEYIVNSEGKLCQIGGDCLEAEVSGESPKNGTTVTINEGIIEKENTNIIMGNYDVKYDSETETVKATEYNPYGYGTKYVIDSGDGVERIFYVLEDGDTTALTTGRIAQAGEVSLIMNQSISQTKTDWIDKDTYLTGGGSEEDWNSGKYNSKGPLKANEFLSGLTTDWNIGEVSLPTGYQIAQASGVSNWDNATQKINLPDWLCYISESNPDKDNWYWTSTGAKYNLKSSFLVYSRQKFMQGHDIYAEGWKVKFFVRPVITVSKDLLG